MQRVYIVKTRKIYLLVVILLFMHVASTLMSNEDDAATQRWALCSLLNDMADSNCTSSLPRIYLTRAGGGGGGGEVVAAE